MPTDGERLSANIQLERMLGEGGMGSIWQAKHLSLNTDVAVKFISASLASNEQIKSRFTREAMAAAQIKSPHIVQIFDHGVAADGSPYIVMELLRGEDLQH